MIWRYTVTGTESFPTLVVVKGSFLYWLLSRINRSSEKVTLENMGKEIALSAGGSLLYSLAQRAYQHQYGGLPMYLLGVRTVGEIEQENRHRRRNGKAPI
jgi:hypothetical protein